MKLKKENFVMFIKYNYQTSCLLNNLSSLEVQETRSVLRFSNIALYYYVSPIFSVRHIE